MGAILPLGIAMVLFASSSLSTPARLSKGLVILRWLRTACWNRDVVLVTSNSQTCRPLDRWSWRCRTVEIVPVADKGIDEVRQPPSRECLALLLDVRHAYALQPQVQLGCLPKKSRRGHQTYDFDVWRDVPVCNHQVAVPVPGLSKNHRSFAIDLKASSMR